MIDDAVSRRLTFEGFSLRADHLVRWHARVAHRVDRLSLQNAMEGLTFVFNLIKALLSRTTLHLEDWGTDLKLLTKSLNRTVRPISADPNSRIPVTLDVALVAAETCLRQIESHLHPILLSRTVSDPQYDKLVEELLVCLGLHERLLPVCVHQLPQNGAALSVLPLDLSAHGEPIIYEDDFDLRQLYGNKTCVVFYTFPSIRSLTSLTLLYHEFGHVFWSKLLMPSEQDALSTKLQEAFPVPLRGTQCAEIASDVFAALVGGYAYASSLLSHLLTKSTWGPKVHKDYVRCGDRGELVLLASRHLGFPAPGEMERLQHAFNFKRRPPEPPVTFRETPLKAFVQAFADSMTQHGVRLWGGVPYFPRDEKGRPDLRGAPLRQDQILSIAALYRCEELKRGRYTEWETETLRQLGIWIQPRPKEKPKSDVERSPRHLGDASLNTDQTRAAD